MKLDHIVLNVADIDASIDFYTSVIGLEAERLEQFRAGLVPFPSVRINADTIIDLFPLKMWDDGSGRTIKPDNLNHFCLALSFSEWNTLRDRLAGAGLVLSKDRTVNFGAHGDGISMYFHDPDGNEIEARYYSGE